MSQPKPIKFPFSDLPNLAVLKHRAAYPPPPSDEECFALWEKYKMLPNIKRHSLMVARIATALAERAYELNICEEVRTVRASALLHDIAKTFCLRYGGGHAMVGAAFTMTETKHYGIAQGVLLHVHWPWDLPEGKDICQLPIFVLYADKRVRHDACVTLDERFEDLMTRYGISDYARQHINKSLIQSKLIEKRLSEQLGCNLNENSFDSGRLVA